MQRCQKCDHQGTLVEGVSQTACVDYYRCPQCGTLWTTTKDEERSVSPELIQADSENSAA
jgi:uncharacterized Zn finger protein